MCEARPGAPAPTLTASLSANPTSGTTATTFTFTAERTGGTATGTITYTSPSCGTGGTLVANSHTGNTDRDFQCTYATTGTRTASMTVSQGGASTTPTASVSVTAATLTASLTAHPTSGTVVDTFTFFATRTGGTATGAITFTAPSCGTGGTLVAGSWTGSTDNGFQCTYATTGTRTATMTVSQGGASSTPTASVAVGHFLSASLTASPVEGTTQTTFVFTARRGTGSTTTGTITFSSPSCGAGGTPNPPITTTGATTASFSCVYNTPGPKTASIRATQGGVSAEASRTITVESFAITTATHPSWVRKGSPFEIVVTTSHPAVCTLTSTAGHNRTEGPGTSLTFGGLVQTEPVVYTILCTHTRVDGTQVTDTETMRINVLPTFGEF